LLASTISTGFGFAFGQIAQPSDATAQGTSSNAAVVRQLRTLRADLATRLGDPNRKVDSATPGYQVTQGNLLNQASDMNRQLRDANTRLLDICRAVSDSAGSCPIRWRSAAR